MLDCLAAYSYIFAPTGLGQLKIIKIIFISIIIKFKEVSYVI